jgi:hypothetical protein
MSSIPLAANNVQAPPNPLQEYAQALSVKNMIGQGQVQQNQITAGQQENQQRQMQLDDQSGLKRALIDANGDFNQFRQNVRDPKYNVSVQGQLQTDNAIMAHQKAAYELDDTALGAQQKKNTALAGYLEPLTEETDFGKVQAELPKIINKAQVDGVITPQQAQEFAANGPIKSIDDLKQHVSGLQMAADQIKQAQDNRKAGIEAWKEQPGTGTMVNVDKTDTANFGKTMPITNGVPVPPELAKTLQAPQLAGTITTPQMLKTYKEAADVGNKVENFNGQMNLIDGNGKTIKTLGTAPAVTTFNLQNAATSGPQAAAMVDLVGQNKVDLGSVLSRMPPAAKAGFLTQLSAKYPDFNQGSFGIEKKVGEQFTSGTYSQQLNAINTAREHMNTFRDLATALDNGDTQALNKVSNAWAQQFGSAAPTNFSLARDAFAGEVGKALAGANVTQGDRNKVDEAISSAESPKQLIGAANTADALLAGKQNALKQTYQQGRTATPNFGQNKAAAPAVGGAATGFTRIKASDGSMHDIPSDKIAAAKKIDPNLQVVQ